MSIIAQQETFPLLRDYLIYMETIKGRSAKTVSEYYTDLRSFFRFMLAYRAGDQKVLTDDERFHQISIASIDLDFIKSIALNDIYEFLYYMTKQRHNSATARARKVSALRGFFKYLTNNMKLLEENPTLNLEIPSMKKSLPKYLTLEQSLELLNSVDGAFQERDYCILTLFLNCGMRLAELVGLDLSDIRENTLRLLGKGNKERVIYINSACMKAIQDYLKVRGNHPVQDSKALFLSKDGRRISRRRVQQIVETFLNKSGLGEMGYSAHKLRHTAATLMYQYGEIDIRVLKDILGHTNLGTTEIYTHVSSKQMEHAAESNPLAGVKQKKKEITNQ
ncbi:MAG: tyrosine recombinase XerC [Oscillospiraceae bacterium]|jgi:integrase/recombinase XerC